MALTARELFTMALRKCNGIIAEGETPSANLIEDARLAFNVMLDGWSAQSLMVYATQDQEFSWPASTASRTVGPSGDLTGNRPILVHDSTYFEDTGTELSYPVQLINEDLYNMIPDKTSTSSFPEVLWVNMTMPNATLTVYPIPDACTLHLISAVALTEVTNLSTELSFPPGYLRALVYNLAVELTPELGMQPLPSTQRIAVSSKQVLKAQNSAKDVMSMPSIFSSNHSFNIYTGD